MSSHAVSDRKIEANRRNALKSTGPRTDAGKAISSQNAIKHEVFCKNMVAPGDDPQEACHFKRDMLRALNPGGWLEMQLVEQIIHDEWRIKRLRRVEQQTYENLDSDLPDCQYANARARRGDVNNTIERFQRYEQRARNSVYRAMRELREIQKGLHKHGDLTHFTYDLLNADDDAREQAEAELDQASAAQEAEAVLQNEATATASKVQQGTCATSAPALDRTNRDVAGGQSAASTFAGPDPGVSDARAA